MQFLAKRLSRVLGNRCDSDDESIEVCISHGPAEGLETLLGRRGQSTIVVKAAFGQRESRAWFHEGIEAPFIKH